MTTTISNTDGFATSLQVSKLKSVPAGNTTFERPVLLKNIGLSNITVTLVMCDESEISTVLYPGWNVELVKGIKGATAGSLQYGY